MKKFLPLSITLISLAAILLTLRAPKNPGDYDVTGFGRLPVLVNGRVKPLDTVARTSLLVMQGRQRVTTAHGRSISPDEWLLDMLFRPAVADTYATFEIVHPDVLAVFNLATSDGVAGKRFSAVQLSTGLRELDRQAKLADGSEVPLRTTFQKAVVQLRDNVMLYQHLQQSVVPLGVEKYLEQLAELVKNGPVGGPAVNAHGGGLKDNPAAKLTLEMSRYFSAMETLGFLRPIPPEKDPATSVDWKSCGAALNEGISTGRFPAAALAFADLGRAWSTYQPEKFNAVLHDYRATLDRSMPAAMLKCDVESRFNSAQPFYSSTMLYVVAFLLAVISWVKWPDGLRRVAYRLTLLAFALTTAGILIRMWLEARPPVTNLYSSALFVGWGAVALCLVLERFYRNAIGSAAGGLIGFATLLIAHHLSLGGDTLEMMRAVLDSNFWLATHVVTIAIGYSATFLAGLLAAIYILRGVLTRSLDESTASALNRMIYGILCFATLFSFVGTILGGIWADQSWGRFWGWDPKENGALIIVMWNSIVLHARWGGMARARGIACLAVFGNIVTAWSWFGVNMLGVGLHSYGFMDSAFWWLIAFVISQLVIIAVATVPVAKWRSSLQPARAV